MDQFVLQLPNGSIIDHNLRHQLIDFCKTKALEQWKKRCCKRTDYYSNNKILKLDENHLFNKSNIRHDKAANLWHKTKQKVASSRNYFHNIYQSILKSKNSM